MNDRSRHDAHDVPVRHVGAHYEARSLILKHDGQAGHVVETELRHSLSKGDTDAALHLDQVRREIERIRKSRR